MSCGWPCARLLGLALTLVLGCRGGEAQVAPPMDIPSDDTSLGAGDVFEVRVYGGDDFPTAYRVARDGTIDFPLIGRLEVAGLEPTGVADLIATRLREAEFFVDPQVSVMVTENNSKRVMVMGAVVSSGTFPMRSGLSAVEAISLAGGFTPLASRNSTVVTRRVNGEVRRFRVPIQDITRGEREDFLLRPGDIVYVPERLF